MAARRRHRGARLARALPRGHGRRHPVPRHRRAGDAALRLVARGTARRRDGALRSAKMRTARGLLAIMIAAAALAALPHAAAAQDWPTRLVRLVVPAAAGGSSDAAARLVSNHFQAVFRQPFIIE